jgi:hypothetical protein
MTDLAIVRWIRELDENGAVGLARALILAEASAHNLPLDGFTMSGRVKVADEGIDGRTHFPEDSGVLLPKGPRVWQVKHGHTEPTTSREFNARKHKGLLQAIRDGYNYVLFWTFDPEDPKRSRVESRFREAVRSIRDDAKVSFLFADQIEQLCYAHLGALRQLPYIPLSGVVSLDVWAPDDFRSVAFQPDENRTCIIEALRSHVSSLDQTPAELHVYGDTGVGKSRLVYEALAVPGVDVRVLVAPDASSLDRRLLTLVAQSPERWLIVVVDDCDIEDRHSLAPYVGMARGRIRLITIGSRGSREQPVADFRYREVLPLEVGASKQIALSVGLEERDADLVAAYTEGYPGLARTLALAIRYGEAASLIDRVRRHEQIGRVLSSPFSPKPTSYRSGCSRSSSGWASTMTWPKSCRSPATPWESRKP